MNGQEDDFIGYEIPVEVGNIPLGDHGSPTDDPVFSLDAIDGRPEKGLFEMMEIHITLYTLSGLLYQKRKPGDKRRRRMNQHASRLKNRSGTKGGGASVASDLQSNFGGTTLSTITDSSAHNDLTGFEMDHTLAPTTAVVSSTRYDPLSQSPMETFIPSMPLHRLSRGDSQALRYNARWNTSSPSRMVQSEQESSPTLKVLRLMHQQQYVRSARIGEVSMYEHEKVDLCVFLGRGKELIPVGVVSFIVTGDEETETVLNLPLKKPAVGSQLFERHFKQTKRKKRTQDYFENDPKHCFSIGGNATLRVGVRAFPQRELKEADERSASAREKEEKVFESVLQKILDRDLLDTLHEETSLVKKLVDGQKEQIKKEDEQKVVEVIQKETAPTPAAIMHPNLFCNFSFFQNYVCPPLPNSTTPAIPQHVVTVKREHSGDSRVSLPLTLVSSVSDSVSTEGGHSNTRFFSDRAKI